MKFLGQFVGGEPAGFLSQLPGREKVRVVKLFSAPGPGVSPRNEAITEGFRRKMELIQRRAYGFKNFHNYRLRVIAQCG